MKVLPLLVVFASSTAAAQPSTVGPHPDHGPPPLPPPLHPPELRSFFSIGIGTGAGWIGGETEALEADVEGGPQWAPLHVRAELAAFRNPRLAFGISARLGFVPGQDFDAPSAKSVMLRIYKMCAPVGLRWNGAIGAGYVRYRARVDGESTDTMAAGPLLLGAGVGWVHKISKSWHVTVDLNAIGAIATSENYAGVPNEHALHFDLDVGLAVYR